MINAPAVNRPGSVRGWRWAVADTGEITRPLGVYGLNVAGGPI